LLCLTNDYLIKLILTGDENVGKTSILKSLTEKVFTIDYIPTIGVEFAIHNIKFINNNNEKIAKLQIWDTAGQKRFRSIVQSYYRGAHIILLVVDLSNIE